MANIPQLCLSRFAVCTYIIRCKPSFKATSDEYLFTFKWPFSGGTFPEEYFHHNPKSRIGFLLAFPTERKTIRR